MLLDILPKIIHIKHEIQLRPFQLNWLDFNKKIYYRYNGSLTTPNCSENVIWTVFADPLEISMKKVIKITLKLSYIHQKIYLVMFFFFLSKQNNR